MKRLAQVVSYTSALAALMMSLTTTMQAQPPVTALAFAPSGDMIVIGSQAGLELRAWPTLEHAAQLPTSLENIHDLSFSPDGHRLAACGGVPADSGIVERYSWPARALVDRRRIFGDLIYSADWRPDSQAVLAVSGEQRAAILNAESRELHRELAGHSRAVLACGWLSRNSALTAGADGTLRVWNTETGELIRSLSQHTSAVYDLAVQPVEATERRLVVTVGGDRTVRFWQPEIGRMVRFARLTSAPLAVVWSSDGALAHAACHDGHVRSVRATNGEVVHDAPAINGVAYCIALAPDGSLLIGGERGALVRR